MKQPQFSDHIYVENVLINTYIYLQLALESSDVINC
jgi:hypothetical protein